MYILKEQWQLKQRIGLEKIMALNSPFQKKEYITSLPKIMGEEETYHQELNDYILTRMKVITITLQQESALKSYLEVLTGRSKSSGKSTDQSISYSNNTNSNHEDDSEKDTERDSITNEITELMQMKMIKELQNLVKVLQDKQQQIDHYIQSLEDTVIALSETDDDSAKHRAARKMAKKIKKKRIDINNKMNEESDTSNNSTIFC